MSSLKIHSVIYWSKQFFPSFRRRPIMCSLQQTETMHSGFWSPEWVAGPGLRQPARDKYHTLYETDCDQRDVHGLMSPPRREFSNCSFIQPLMHMGWADVWIPSTVVTYAFTISVNPNLHCITLFPCACYLFNLAETVYSHYFVVVFFYV